MRLPIRPSTLVLVVLGLGMLVLGVWVEDRAAVAAPLVIIGALVVVAGVVVETWADIEEMSLGQAGIVLMKKLKDRRNYEEALRRLSEGWSPAYGGPSQGGGAAVPTQYTPDAPGATRGAAVPGYGAEVPTDKSDG
jgi:hypothetical protein